MFYGSGIVAYIIALTANSIDRISLRINKTARLSHAVELAAAVAADVPA